MAIVFNGVYARLSTYTFLEWFPHFFSFAVFDSHLHLLLQQVSKAKNICLIWSGFVLGYLMQDRILFSSKIQVKILSCSCTTVWFAGEIPQTSKFPGFFWSVEAAELPWITHSYSRNRHRRGNAWWFLLEVGCIWVCGIKSTQDFLPCYMIFLSWNTDSKLLVPVPYCQP